MTKTWCVGCKHKSDTNNIIEYEKLNPKNKKLVKIITGSCSICGRNKSKLISKQMTRGEDFMKKGRCKNKHCSNMSNSAWTDLNSQGDILKLLDKCPNPKRGCQKIITFTSHQYMLEGGSIKSKLQKIFKRTQTAWNKFLKPAINATAPFVGMAVSAKTKNPKVGQATTNIMMSMSGGKILPLTDLQGRGLRLKVM